MHLHCEVAHSLRTHRFTEEGHCGACECDCFCSSSKILFYGYGKQGTPPDFSILLVWRLGGRIGRICISLKMPSSPLRMRTIMGIYMVVRLVKS